MVSGIYDVIEARGLEWGDEYRYRCADGSYATVADRGILFLEDDGRPVHMIGGMADITERKHVEKALRESEERYQTILQTIEDGYFEVDLAGNFTFFNDAMLRILGYSQDEMMGLNYRTYIDAGMAEHVYRMVTSAGSASPSSSSRTGSVGRSVFEASLATSPHASGRR